MISSLKRLLRPAARERGVALPVVIGISLVLLITISASTTVALGGLKKTKTDEDWNGALQAAYAGVDEYTSRLANDPNYYGYGNKNAPFTISSGSASTVTPPPTANDALDYTAGGTWGSIPGATDAKFRYEVDNHLYQSAGALRIRVTGKVGSQVRSLIVDMKQSGFLDFMYFTIYETQDPLTSGRTDCGGYAYDGRPASCDIQFAPFDDLQGPVHSNDRLYICGANFEAKVTSSSPNGNYRGGCGTPTFNTTKNPDNKPIYRTTIDMPPSNGDLKTQTYSGTAAVPDPGCLYTGPTIITFLAGGKMNVISPFSKFTSPTAAGVGYNNPDNRCGKVSDLQSSMGATINTLPNNLVYVQSVPASTSTDPNRRLASDVTPPSISCTTGTDQQAPATTTSGGFKINGPTYTGQTYAYPLANEVLDPSDSSTARPAYSCTNGDAYVSDAPGTAPGGAGQFGGKMTIATSNYIYVTSDIEYGTPASDVLGLVGDQAIWIYNPIVKTGSSTYSYSRFENRSITAALLAVNHTIQVQNYDGCYRNCRTGSAAVILGRKTLTVNGIMAQKYRGPVGVSYGGSNFSGFAKNYSYDTRFQYVAPPKFLKPASTTYATSQFADTKPAYTPSGAPIP